MMARPRLPHVIVVRLEAHSIHVVVLKSEMVVGLTIQEESIRIAL